MDIRKRFLLAKNILTCKFYRYSDNFFVLPYRIKIFLTYACNSRCKHCGIWKIYRADPGRKNEELSTLEWEELFRKMGKDLFILSISGGEPFLRSDLKDIIVSATGYCKNLLAININTNGTSTQKIYNVVESILEEMPKGIKLQISISCDGTEQTHDYLRGTPGGFARAAKTFELLSHLKCKYSNLRILKNITINAKNIDEVEKLLDNFSKNNIQFMCSFALDASHFNYDRESMLAVSCIPRDKVLKALKSIEQRISPIHGEELFQKIYIKLAKKYFNRSSGQVLPCYSSWSSVKIDPYGRVFPCIVMLKSLGSLRQSNFDLSRILQSPETVHVRQKIRGNRCVSCWDPNDAYITILQNFPLGILKKVFQSEF